MSGNGHTQSLVIGDQHIKVDAITKKIEQDILFLQDKIAAIEKQTTPNTIILKVYQEMLTSRVSVLSWLKEYTPADQDENAKNNLTMTS
jgi:hypothetical protein